MVSSLSEVLRDAVFLMQVLMKGRMVTMLNIDSVEKIESIISQQLNKGLYLLSGRIRVGNQEVSTRMIVYNGKLAFVLVERGGTTFSGLEALKSIVEEVKKLTLNVFEITPELIETYPALREVSKTSEDVKTEVVSERIMEVQAVETETAPMKAEDQIVEVKRVAEVAKPEIVEPIEKSVTRILNALNVDVYGFSMSENEEEIRVELVASSYRKEISHNLLVWVIASRLFETYVRSVMRKKLIIEVEYNGERRVTILDTELAKWLAYFNGTVLRVLLPHGFYIDNVKTSVSADGTYVELTYYVKSNIEKYASRTMLARLAYECVREIKKFWPHRIRVRLRAGLFTEGRAEA